MGLLFRSPPEITIISPQSRGTGGYVSAPAVPLKPPFFLSASVKCLIVRSGSLCFYPVFWSKWPFYTFLGNNLLRSEILKFKTSEHSDPPFHHEFIFNVIYARFVLVGGFNCANPGEWLILPGQSPSMSLLKA